MILHALQTLTVKTDYMVGAMLEGFEVMVNVEDDSKYMVLEGDE
jgi:UDP-N-acetylmuramate: L-alanyl-gamma-D-glutamyl-meso-diaminopimelate ligase